MSHAKIVTFKTISSGTFALYFFNYLHLLSEIGLHCTVVIPAGWEIRKLVGIFYTLHSTVL